MVFICQLHYLTLVTLRLLLFLLQLFMNESWIWALHLLRVRWKLLLFYIRRFSTRHFIFGRIAFRFCEVPFILLHINVTKPFVVAPLHGPLTTQVRALPILKHLLGLLLSWLLIGKLQTVNLLRAFHFGELLHKIWFTWTDAVLGWLNTLLLTQHRIIPTCYSFTLVNL